MSIISIYAFEKSFKKKKVFPSIDWTCVLLYRRKLLFNPICFTAWPYKTMQPVLQHTHTISQKLMSLVFCCLFVITLFTFVDFYSSLGWIWGVIWKSCIVPCPNIKFCMFAYLLLHVWNNSSSSLSCLSWAYWIKMPW